ncbi:MAG: hypothetical protein QNJ85_10780 [Gammaproteobacteria bacterium]|nr:hypothetical protein [Gammaproteobacteria bacterium]
MRRIFLAPLVLMLLSIGASAQAAETGTVQAAIPWDGEGRVYQVNPTTIVFMGALEGIIYVESATGDMNEGFVVCPVMQLLDAESGTTQATGHCEITASPNDVLYAKMTCTGEFGGGGCSGDFELTDGEGKFEGISGSGKLTVRSPLGVISKDMSSGAVVRVATGLAQIKDLKYSIP